MIVKYFKGEYRDLECESIIDDRGPDGLWAKPAAKEFRYTGWVPVGYDASNWALWGEIKRQEVTP